jgi:GT2 family glycosyltransferase
MSLSVSFVIATYNRKDDLVKSVEGVLSQEYRPLQLVVISNSTDGTRTLFEDEGRFDDSRVDFYHYDERMGVTGARNIGYKKATGDIIVNLDDDAILRDPSATERIVDLFESEPDLGAAAFRVVNHYSEQLEMPLQPSGLEQKIPFLPPQATFPSDEEITEPYETTYFPGCANALRASALEEVGTFPQYFFYGVEEEDLSFRLMDAGYSIKYLPTITVRHKRSPEGRIPKREEMQTTLENRIAVAVRNLPWRYAVQAAVLWTGSTLVRSNFDLPLIAAAYRNVLGKRDQLLEERSVLSSSTINHIKGLGGRLY